MKMLFIASVFCCFSAVVAAKDLPMGKPIGAPLGVKAQEDLSGAYYDGESLWLVTNSNGYVWNIPVNNGKVDEAGAQQWKIHKASNFEAITHDGNANPQTFILLAESKPSLIEYTFSGTCTAEKKCAKKGRTWKLPRYLAESRKGFGAEGLTWIPETHFDDLDPTDINGLLCDNGCAERRRKPDNALDGLYLVAHQSGGFIYAFRLMNDKSVSLYGKYATRAEESAGLEYDQESRRLYIWHGGEEEDVAIDPAVNTLEKARLVAMTNGEKPARLESEPLRQYRLTDGAVNNRLNLEGIGLRNNRGALELFLVADDETSSANLLWIDLD